MGVSHKDDFDRFRVLVWASAVKARAAGRTTLIRELFSGRNGEDPPSTQYYRCLAEGRPWPDFERTADSTAPALLIEARFPGTLIWLIHPIWDGISAYCSYTLDGMFHELLAMRSSVQEIMMRPWDDRYGDEKSRLVDTFAYLEREGSLDALLAASLVPRQAFCMARADLFPFTARLAVELVPRMKCLQWMPPDLQTMFVKMVCRTIVEEQATPPSASEARQRRLFKVRLDIAESTGKSPQGIDDELEIALEGTGVIKRHAVGVELPEPASGILDRLNQMYGSDTQYLDILNRLDVRNR